MCDFHDHTFGKQAVLALKEATDNPGLVCQKRLEYLENKVAGFRVWLLRKGYNPQEFIDNLHRFGAEGNQRTGSYENYICANSGRMMPYCMERRSLE